MPRSSSAISGRRIFRRRRASKALQSVTAGIDLIDVPSLPPGVTVCSIAGHEQAIAEYCVMTMLARQHRLIDIATAFRGGVWSTGGGAGGGPNAWRDHGQDHRRRRLREDRSRGRQTRRRLRLHRVIAANRSPVADRGDASELYPLAELPTACCRAATLSSSPLGWGPETARLIDARRLALMKPTAFLINIGQRRHPRRGRALRRALKNNAIGGAAIDVWWQYPTAAEPNRHGVAPAVSRIAQRDPDAALLEQGDRAARATGALAPLPAISTAMSAARRCRMWCCGPEGANNGR